MIRTAVLGILTLGLCYVLDNPLELGGTATPPLGSFLSPFHGFWNNAERLGDYEDVVINELDLTGPVEVFYDERLVPHVFGESIEDALYVQGYLHAKHRLWQMDISTRSAAGRVSEVLGERSLEYDKRRRRMGMGLAAENALKGWSKYPNTYRLINQYVKGVNAYIETLEPRDYPLEFKLLGYAPEEWTTLHSALFQKNMALTLCAGYADVENSNMLAHFGQETFDFLYPEWNPKQTPIIPRSVEWDFDKIAPDSDKTSPIEEVGYIKGGVPSPLEKGIGSNNWAVDGSKTKSGNPILCGDPHLQLTLPSIWYEMHIQAEDINSYGATLPSIPGIIIGFNDHIAWSETNVGHDVWDFYKIKWVDDQKTKYIIDGEEKEVEYRIEEIKTKGGEIIIDTIKITELGLVASYNNSDEYEDLVFDWLPHRVPDKNEMQTFLGINKATNYEEFAEALTNYVSPAQNFVFACVDGDIAMTVNGDFPIKEEQAGRFISDGSSSNGNWKGFIPRDHIPKVLNPERGFVSSANQYSTGPEYPYYYNGNGYFEQYRGRILNEKLAAKSNITPDDMMALQHDAESLKAREVLPIMLANINAQDLDDFGKRMYSTLSEWNHIYTPDSEGASFFEEWFSQVYDATFDEIEALEEKMEVKNPAEWVLVRMIEEQIDHSFFDIQSTGDKIESGQDILRQAFGEAKKHFTEKGTDQSFPWHEHRRKSINHLAGLEALSRKNIVAKGHGDALNAYGSSAGPSWRMVVSMDQQVTAKVVYPGGQSGNPGSKFYDDMIDSWISGNYYDARFVKDKEQLKDHILFKETFNKKP